MAVLEGNKMLEKVAVQLIGVFVGAWVFWVTRSIFSLLKDMDAAHNKLRGKDK